MANICKGQVEKIQHFLRTVGWKILLEELKNTHAVLLGYTCQEKIFPLKGLKPDKELTHFGRAFEPGIKLPSWRG